MLYTYSTKRYILWAFDICISTKQPPGRISRPVCDKWPLQGLSMNVSIIHKRLPFSLACIGYAWSNQPPSYHLNFWSDVTESIILNTDSSLNILEGAFSCAFPSHFSAYSIIWNSIFQIHFLASESVGSTAHIYSHTEAHPLYGLSFDPL